MRTFLHIISVATSALICWFIIFFVGHLLMSALYYFFCTALNKPVLSLRPIFLLAAGIATTAVLVGVLNGNITFLSPYK